jgi:hypothetical protein
MSPLHIAAKLDYASVVQYLVSKNASVNALTQDGTASTALHVAEHAGALDAFRALLGAKADANVKDASGSTPLHYASSLIEGKANLDSLYPTVVAALMANKANLNIANKAGDTALLVATRLKNYALATSLMNAKAELNTQNLQGNSEAISVGKMSLEMMFAVLCSNLRFFKDNLRSTLRLRLAMLRWLKRFWKTGTTVFVVASTSVLPPVSVLFLLLCQLFRALLFESALTGRAVPTLACGTRTRRHLLRWLTTAATQWWASCCIVIVRCSRRLATGREGERGVVMVDDFEKDKRMSEFSSK